VASREEKWTRAQADRPATEEESSAAESAMDDIDLDRVAAHAAEMAKLGANVHGAGQIVPDPENVEEDV